MGAFRYPLQVGDPQGLRFETVEALVDTGATFTVIPASVLERLGVPRSRRRSFRLADDRVVEQDTGETLVRLEGQTIATVVVFGPEGRALLGVYTLEMAQLAVDPVRQRLLPTEALLMAAQSEAAPEALTAPALLFIAEMLERVLAEYDETGAIDLSTYIEAAQAIAAARGEQP